MSATCAPLFRPCAAAKTGAWVRRKVASAGDARNTSAAANSPALPEDEEDEEDDDELLLLLLLLLPPHREDCMCLDMALASVPKLRDVTEKTSLIAASHIIFLPSDGSCRECSLA